MLLRAFKMRKLEEISQQNKNMYLQMYTKAHIFVKILFNGILFLTLFTFYVNITMNSVMFNDMFCLPLLMLNLYVVFFIFVYSVSLRKFVRLKRISMF